MTPNEISKVVNNLVSKSLNLILDECGGDITLAMMINVQINVELNILFAQHSARKDMKENFKNNLFKDVN